MGRSTAPRRVVANLPPAVRAAWMAPRCTLQRRLAHTGVGVVWCSTSGYSRGPHRVLKEYRVSETGVPRRRGVGVSHSVVQSTAPLGVCRESRGTLQYSQGTPASLVPRRVPIVSEAHPSALCAHCGCLVSDYGMHWDLARAQRRPLFRPTSATPTRRRTRRPPPRRRMRRRCKAVSATRIRCR